jgi:hypothetical protein
MVPPCLSLLSILIAIMVTGSHDDLPVLIQLEIVRMHSLYRNDGRITVEAAVARRGKSNPHRNLYFSLAPVIVAVRLPFQHAVDSVTRTCPYTHNYVSSSRRLFTRASQPTRSSVDRMPGWRFFGRLRTGSFSWPNQNRSKILLGLQQRQLILG